MGHPARAEPSFGAIVANPPFSYRWEPTDAMGGWRIIRTLGHKMVKLQPVHGFAAETTAATVLAVAVVWLCNAAGLLTFAPRCQSA